MGTAGLHWVLHPAMYVPLKEICYSAPQYGRYIQTEGRKGVPPTPEFQRIIDNYHELIHTYDNPQRQLELGRNILWQWSRECYFIGLHRDHALAIVSSRFRNFPDHILHGWRVMFPGYMQPEQFYLESEQHKIRAEAGPNGSVFPSGEFQVYHGNEQEFNFTPNDGYVVVDVSVDGESVGPSMTYRIERVRRAHAVKARFQRKSSQAMGAPEQ